jgi:hypothetical protein
MLELKPELHENETVLGEYGATVYQVKGGLSSKGSNIRLFLTDQRLILKAGIGPQRSLSLHAIRDIRQEKIGFYNMARLEFPEGHLEWFTVQNQAQFLQVLQSVRAQAPEIPEENQQASFNPGFQTTRNKTVIIILVIAGIVLLCICLLTVLIGVYLFFLQAH